MFPEVFRQSRRLGGAFFDHCNPRSFLHPNGATQPKSELVNPQLYSPPAMWEQGAKDAAQFLAATTGADDPPLFSIAEVDWRAIAGESNKISHEKGLKLEFLRPGSKEAPRMLCVQNITVDDKTTPIAMTADEKRNLGAVWQHIQRNKPKN